MKQRLRRNNSSSMERCTVEHSDVCGPISVSFFGVSRYFAAYYDNYSGYIVYIHIKLKSDVSAKFKTSHAWL